MTVPSLTTPAFGSSLQNNAFIRKTVVGNQQLPRLGAKYRGLTLKTCLRVLNPRL